MVKNVYLLIFMFFLLLSFDSESIPTVNSSPKNPHESSEWKFIREENGFKLYNASYPNSSVLGFKGETIVDYPIDRVFSVFYDYTRQKEWIDRLKHVEIVKMIDFGKRVVYSQGSLPWPISDRDFLMENGCTFDIKIRQVNCTMRSLDPENYPQYKNSDHVRANIMSGGFQLNDIGNGKTKVMVYLHGDPMGYIPSFVVNIIQESWPQNSIDNLKKQLAKKDITIMPQIASWIKTGVMPELDKSFLSSSVNPHFSN